MGTLSRPHLTRVYRPRRSYYFLWTLAIQWGGAMVCLFMTPLAPGLHALLAVLIVIYCRYWQRKQHTILEFYEENDGWKLQTCQGDTWMAKLDKSSVVTRYLLGLRFLPVDQKKIRYSLMVISRQFNDR